MAISTEFRPLGGSERARTSSARLVEALRDDESIGITILVRSKPGAPPLPDLAHCGRRPRRVTGNSYPPMSTRTLTVRRTRTWTR